MIIIIFSLLIGGIKGEMEEDVLFSASVLLKGKRGLRNWWYMKRRLKVGLCFNKSHLAFWVTADI